MFAILFIALNAAALNGVAQPQVQPEASLEASLEVRGIDSFLKIQTFKTLFVETFPQIPIEERSIKQGVQRFVIRPNVPLDVLLQKFTAAARFSQAGLKFDISSINSEEAVLQLR